MLSDAFFGAFMQCVKPILIHGQGLVPCGQCLACKINLRRKWVCRNLLEMYDHHTAAFLTLTYRPECLPDRGLLDKTHVPGFLKRLRARGYKVRYYGCGEYGLLTHRPHYHLILYGFSPRLCEPGHRCEDDWLCTCWGFGHVDAGDVNKDSIQYVAGYTLKSFDDNRRGWCFVVPPYSIMSRRPGIGRDAFLRLCESAELRHDLPANVKSIRIGGQFWPLAPLLSEAYGDHVFHGSHPQMPKVEVSYNRFAAKQRLGSWLSRRSPRVL